MKKILPYGVFILFLIGCKGAVGPTGPAGPKLNGNLKGFVNLRNVDGTYQTDMTGVKVAITGTSDSAKTDVNGKFELTNVETGTYEIVYSLASYGSFKYQGFSFASGGTASLGTITLGVIPVSSPLPVLTPNSIQGTGVTVNGALASAATTIQYYRVYVGKSSTINPLDPTTYLASKEASVNANSSRFSTAPSWTVSDLRSLGIINSTTANLWFACYPYNRYCDSYTDINTNVDVYPAVPSQGSAPVSASTP